MLSSIPYLPEDVPDTEGPPARAAELALIDPDMAELPATRPRRQPDPPPLHTVLEPFIHKAIDALQVAVPMRQPATTAPLTLRQQQALGNDLQRHSDALLGAAKPGTSRFALNALAETLATLSHQPGGVTFMGVHWCTDHRVCGAAP